MYTAEGAVTYTNGNTVDPKTRGGYDPRAPVYCENFNS